ncbi:MAG: ATP-binding protein, partial [Acetobacter sp.]|nr:ATP-binding protein [Acetobacter sp.]
MRTDDSYRSIGRVTSMTADAFTIELHHRLNHFTTVGFDDIHYLAQIGSFMMIPLLSDYIVTEIVELWEKDPTNRSPIQEENTHKFTKTTSTKYLKVIPLGTLPKDINKEFCSGISAFPSLYTEALYILDKELDRIFNVKDEGQQEEAKKYITIGTSTVFEKYDIKIRLDDYFGRHSAILGNTGSGKSCTMAAVLQSLFKKEPQNATFIIFDVHGEYKQAFSAHSYKRITRDHQDQEDDIFILPPSFLSLEEWASLLRPSSQSQKPALEKALEALDPKSFHNVGTLLTKIQELKSNKKFLLPNNGHNKDFYNRLSNIQTSRNFSFLRNNENLSQNKKEEYIEEYIKGLLGFETKNTEKTKKQHQIIILDLQEASDEALGLISAVLARLIFEWIRNSDKKDRCPIHFILDEAHRYIPAKFSSNFNNDSSPQGTHIHTYDTLERLAKEGRKYGIFLQVISQRPSELSKTVLSQCSNFIIHKIQNPDDLRYIQQMTPYISESITKRLPSLPQRHALV